MLVCLTLSGDLEIAAGVRPMSTEAQAWAEARGARLSARAERRALLTGPSIAVLLVDLRTIDTAWPLVGEALLAGTSARRPLGGIAIDRTAAVRLGVVACGSVRQKNARPCCWGSWGRCPTRLPAPALSHWCRGRWWI